METKTIVPGLEQAIPEAPLIERTNGAPERPLKPEEKALIDRIHDQLRTTGNIAVVNGAFGDISGCHGLLEAVIQPNDGGTFTKIYGCQALFKGFPDMSVLEGMGLAKAMISAIPRELVAKNWWAIFSLAFSFIFQRKKFIHSLHIYFSTIYCNEIMKFRIPPERYNKPAKEIKRAAYAVIESRNLPKVYDANNEEVTLLHQNFFMQNDREFYELVANLVEFVALFIELDSAYRFRLQDVITLVNKDAVRKNVVKEVRRVMQILIDRENPECGIAYKIVPSVKLFTLLMYLSKDVRNFTRDFLLELDLEKVGLDEEDWYFVYQRKEHNYGGLPLDERIAKKLAIDMAKGNIHLLVEHQAMEGRRGIKVTVVD